MQLGSAVGGIEYHAVHRPGRQGFEDREAIAQVELDHDHALPDSSRKNPANALNPACRKPPYREPRTATRLL